MKRKTRRLTSRIAIPSYENTTTREVDRIVDEVQRGPHGRRQPYCCVRSRTILIVQLPGRVQFGFKARCLLLRPLIGLLQDFLIPYKPRQHRRQLLLVLLHLFPILLTSTIKRLLGHVNTLAAKPHTLRTSQPRIGFHHNTVVSRK